MKKGNEFRCPRSSELKEEESQFDI